MLYREAHQNKRTQASFLRPFSVMFGSVYGAIALSISLMAAFSCSTIPGSVPGAFRSMLFSSVAVILKIYFAYFLLSCKGMASFY
jgi:hypothetical protein